LYAFEDDIRLIPLRTRDFVRVIPFAVMPCDVALCS
jgi:hypothetical protein